MHRIPWLALGSLNSQRRSVAASFLKDFAETRRLFESNPQEWACVGYSMGGHKSSSRRRDLLVRLLWRHSSGSEVVMVLFASVHGIAPDGTIPAARYRLRPRVSKEKFEAIENRGRPSAAWREPPA